MPQPTIITAQSTGYAADSDANATTRTYSDVVIPANANTVIIWVTGDTTEDFESFSNITYGDSAAVRTHLVDVSSAAPRMMMASVFDVSSAGALTADVTVTFATTASVATRLGIVCTTGFLESFFSSQDRSAQEGQSIAFSPNYENNLFVLCNAADDFNGSFSYTTGTQIFQSSAGGTAVGVAAASQATNLSDGSKKIAYTAPTEEVTDFGVLFSTQRNPFEQANGMLRNVVR